MLSIRERAVGVRQESGVTQIEQTCVRQLLRRRPGRRDRVDSSATAPGGVDVCGTVGDQHGALLVDSPGADVGSAMLGYVNQGWAVVVVVTVRTYPQIEMQEQPERFELRASARSAVIPCQAAAAT
ncbi:hypothetical protein [Nocardia heshunensis]